MGQASRAWRISLAYLVFAGGWILASDYLVALLPGDAEASSLVQSVKGVSFVLATALLLYLVLRQPPQPTLKGPSASKPRGWVQALVFGFVAIALLLTGWSTDRALRGHERVQAHQRLRAVGDLKVGQISQWLRERRGDIALVAQDPLLAHDFPAWLEDPRGQPLVPTQLARRFAGLRDAHGYGAMILFDGEGRPRWTSSPGFDEVDDRVRELAQRAMKTGAVQLVGFHLQRGAGGRRVDVGYVSAIPAGEGKPGGGLGAVYLVADAQQELLDLVQAWPWASVSGETLVIFRSRRHGISEAECTPPRRVASGRPDPACEQTAFDPDLPLGPCC